MKFARILESIGTKPGLCIELIIHNEFLLKSLFMYGSPEQKQKYMKQLSDGSLKGAFCFSEPHTGVDAARLKLEAKLVEKSNKLYLNGSKAWITLPSDLNNSENLLLFVIAKVIVSEHENQDENFEISSFIIEKNQILDGELKFNKQLDVANGLSLYEVVFNNVSVPLNEAKLGTTLDTGYQITTNLYENSRHYVGAVSIGLLKDLYRTTIEHSINNMQFNRSISEFQMIKERLCKIESRIFAMESMTYLTAGIVDSYEIPDIALEGALTKIYCTEALKASVNDCIQILAMSKYKNLTDIQNKYLNTVDCLSLFLNTNDVLRHYVAFHGASASATAHAEKIRKSRDLFNNPGFGMRLFFEKWKLNKQLEKKEIGYYNLHDGLHPSLKECAYKLEFCSVKLVDAVENAFVEQGTEIVDYQLNMKRLTQMALEIYLMNSCIARSSRSYSIGLNNCDFDFYLASVNCHYSIKRFNNQYEELISSTKGLNVDNLIINIADRALREKRQSSSHCLNRTYD
jgi:acyl-CoA dehydrogenase family protein 9